MEAFIYVKILLWYHCYFQERGHPSPKKQICNMGILGSLVLLAEVLSTFSWCICCNFVQENSLYDWCPHCHPVRLLPWVSPRDAFKRILHLWLVPNVAANVLSGTNCWSHNFFAGPALASRCNLKCYIWSIKPFMALHLGTYSCSSQSWPQTAPNVSFWSGKESWGQEALLLDRNISSLEQPRCGTQTGALFDCIQKDAEQRTVPKWCIQER